MFTPRMRRRRRLLDTYIRVELEERPTLAEKRPLESREAAPQGGSGASHVEPGSATESATETASGRIPREARGAAI
jgi:hypothetical protein